MGQLYGLDDRPSPGVNFAEYSPWVLERVLEAGVDPDKVTAIGPATDAFGRGYIQWCEIGYIDQPAKGEPRRVGLRR